MARKTPQKGPSNQSPKAPKRLVKPSPKLPVPPKRTGPPLKVAPKGLIQNVVIFFRENHAFDNYFGVFPRANGATMAHAHHRSSYSVALGRRIRVPHCWDFCWVIAYRD